MLRLKTLETEWRNNAVRAESISMLKKKKRKVRDELKKLRELYKYEY